nr:hypothetical protein [Tanacetum cinerariifolium]
SWGNSYIRRAGGYVLHTELNEPSSEVNKYLVSYLSGDQSFTEGDSDQPVYSIKESIRTGTLSKRWRHLWPQLPNLVFEYNVNDEDRISQLDYSNTKALYAMKIHEHHQTNKELFKGLILSVSHFKELKVGKSCLE